MGSPAGAKMGSFWLSTNVLNTSIMGMPVRTILRGMIRFDGFTEGPPASMGSSSRAGRPSRGRPAPSKTRPSSASEKGTWTVRPRKRTWASVGRPRLPAKTWRATVSPSRRMTWASEAPPGQLTSASSR